MMDTLGTFVGWLLPALVAAGLLATVVLLVRFTPRATGMTAARRATLQRWTPVFVGALLLCGLAWELSVVLRGERIASYVAFLVLVLVVVGAAWYALRDVVGGVFWRAGRTWQRGDIIALGGLQGRIERLGYRVVVVQGDRGEQILIPYTELLRGSVSLHAEANREHPHTFLVKLLDPSTAGQAREQAIRAAMLCHGASILREPDLSQRGPDSLEVTVFTLAPTFAPAVEQAVRRAIEGPASRTIV